MNDLSELPEIILGISKYDVTGTNGSTAEIAIQKLKHIVLFSGESFENRKISAIYLSKILFQATTDVLDDLVSYFKILLLDDKIPIDLRYAFFFGQGFRFNGYIVQSLHRYYYQNFPEPALYKILSAGYLLEYSVMSDSDRQSMEDYLFCIAKDSDPVLCAESSDILSRVGKTQETRLRAKHITSSIGVEPKSMNHIYLNTQNVHDSSVIGSALVCLRRLAAEHVMYEHNITELISSIGCEDQIQRILIDPSRFEGYTLSSILIMVWNKIYGNKELEQRLKDELLDSSVGSQNISGCSSGYFVRLMNVLSGFEEYSIKISCEAEILSAVCARLNYYLSKLDESTRTIVILEMGSTQNETLKEFIDTWSPRDELWEEYKGIIERDEFDRLVDKAIQTYSGIKDENF